MSPNDKPLVWLHGEVQTPPFSKIARLEAGYLLRALQRGAEIIPAAVPPDAFHWGALSRTTDSRREFELENRVPD